MHSLCIVIHQSGMYCSGNGDGDMQTLTTPKRYKEGEKMNGWMVQSSYFLLLINITLCIVSRFVPAPTCYPTQAVLLYYFG